MVLADAPDSVKKILRTNYSSFFGPAGILEQEDSEVWVQQFLGSNIDFADDHRYFYGLGLGEEAGLAAKCMAINGTASFRRNIRSTTACQVKGVPFNTAITVTNLDNSRSVQCIASVGGTEPDDDVVLHADAFLQIADLTDAPVPVQITW